jgi:hypothetical protein
MQVTGSQGKVFRRGQRKTPLPVPISRRLAGWSPFKALMIR